MSGWSKKKDTDSIVLSFFHSPYTLPKLSLSVYSGLNFSVPAYNWFLPDGHYIYSDHKRSLKHTSISTLMATLQSAQICEGLSKEEHIVSLCEDPSPSFGTSSVMRHTIPIEQKFYKEDDPPFQAHVFIRSEYCVSCFAMTFHVLIVLRRKHPLGKRKKIQSREQQSLSKVMHLCLAQVTGG